MKYKALNYSGINFAEKFESRTHHSNKQNPNTTKPSPQNSIKVVVVLEEPYLKRNLDQNSNKSLPKVTGYVYDIWEEVKKKLRHKYTFVETIVKTEDYNTQLENVAKDIYQIGIANFMVSEERIKKVDFTNSIQLDPIVIVNRPLSYDENIIGNYIIYTVLPIIILLISLGMILGILLYQFDKHRGYKRSILTAIASLFGEAGFLSERWGPDSRTFKKLHMRALPMILLIFIISYFFSMGMQAYVTAKAVTLAQADQFTVDTVKGKTFILPHGYSDAMAHMVRNYGGKVIKEKDTKVKDLLKQVQDRKYDGIVMPQQRAEYELRLYKKTFPNLIISKNVNLAIKPASFIINKKYLKIKEDIDVAIVKAKETPAIVNACKAHFPHIDHRFMCDI